MGRSTLIDLTGQTFGRLTVLHRAPNRGKQVYWVCECSCENHTIKEVRGASLKNGHTTSCGCWKKEVDNAKITNYNKLVGAEDHGMSNTRLYSIWVDMNRRCYDPSRERFMDYGGRCIEVCDEWRNSFVAFYNWATTNGYSDELTLDRIDTNGNYTPYNCRWTTYLVQNNNSNHNRMVTIDGVTRNLKQWCNELNIDYHRVRSRLAKGWSEEEALLTPIGQRRPKN